MHRGSSYGRGARLPLANRAFLLFLLVISMYGLSSLWFVMNPREVPTTVVVENRREPKIMQKLKADINEFSLLEIREKAQKDREREDEEFKRQKAEEESRESEGAINDFINRAQGLKNEKKWDEAMAVLNEGSAKFPNADKLLGHKGGWYFDKEDWNNAAKYFASAHERNKGDFYWVQNVAMCLGKQEKGAEAAQWLWKAYDVKRSINLLSSICDIQWKFNDFNRYDELINEIMTESENSFSRGEAPNVNPFSALHSPYNAEQIYHIAEKQTKNLNDIARRKTETSETPVWDGKRRIRVGYISPDIRHHAVGIQIQSMFEYHNRSEFEIFVFSCYEGSSHSDEIYQKIKRNIDHMVDVHEADVYQAAKKINSHQVDILIDIGLFTAYARMDVFALRPATISAAWLGSATTTGSKFYDYIIADPFVVLPEHEQFYSEKIVASPHSYHIFDHKQYYPFTPKADTIKSEYFHTPIPKDTSNPPFFFCNHQNNYRLDPYIFSDWMQILDTTPNSSFILKYYNDESRSNLEKEARRYKNIRSWDGKTKETNEWYSILFQRGGGLDHIAKKTICNSYLDIPKYNGHSTSGDMSWGGVPLITHPLTTMASRAAGSFAITSGIPELIANSSAHYIESARHYGTHPKEMKVIRKRLEEGRQTNPSFDTYLFTKHLEESYRQMMHVKWVENSPPRRIDVKNQINKYGAAVRAKEEAERKQREEERRKSEEEEKKKESKALEEEKARKDAEEATKLKDKPAGPSNIEDAIIEKQKEIKNIQVEHQSQKEKQQEEEKEKQAATALAKPIPDAEDHLAIKDKPVGLETPKNK